VVLKEDGEGRTGKADKERKSDDAKVRGIKAKGDEGRGSGITPSELLGGGYLHSREKPPFCDRECIISNLVKTHGCPGLVA